VYGKIKKDSPARRRVFYWSGGQVVYAGTTIYPLATKYPMTDKSNTNTKRMPNSQFSQRFSGLFTQ
jgi:hypothetical protein